MLLWNIITPKCKEIKEIKNNSDAFLFEGEKKIWGGKQNKKLKETK